MRRRVFTVAGTRIVVMLDGTTRTAKLIVHRHKATYAGGGSQTRPARPKRLAFVVAHRRVAAAFDPSTLTAEVTVSERRPTRSSPAAVLPPPEQLVAAGPLAAAAPSLPAAVPPLQTEPEPAPFEAAAVPEVEPEPKRRDPSQPFALPSAETTASSRRGHPVRLAFILGAIVLAALGVVAAVASMRTDGVDTAQAPPTTTVRPPVTPPPQTTTASPTTMPRAVSTAAPQAPATPETTSTTVVAGATHVGSPHKAKTLQQLHRVRWTPVPNASVYWFELYRVGRLGSRKILEAWPTRPEFSVPLRASDGQPLVPGLYNWSASPEPNRRARVRSTTLARAGRFRITQEGELLLNP